MKLMMMFGAALVGGAVALPPLAAAETRQSFRSTYSVTLLGIPIGRSSVESHFTESGFEISGNVASAGLATMFDSTSATVSASGRFAGAEIRPDAYATNYKSGRRQKATSVRFSGGRVASASNTPPVNTNRAGWVPLSQRQLSGVVDPLSATLVRASGPGQVCNRTLRVFDGSMLADLTLSPAGTGRVSIPGYSGETINCAARFNPVAGYRKGSRSLEYVRNSSNISISFAPIGTTGVYAPVEASVGTRVGTVRIAASRLEPIN